MDRQVMGGKRLAKVEVFPYHENLIPLLKDCQAQALIGLSGRISSLHFLR